MNGDGEMNMGLCVCNGAKKKVVGAVIGGINKRRYGINVACRCREYDKQMFAEENELMFVCWEI